MKVIAVLWLGLLAVHSMPQGDRVHVVNDSGFQNDGQNYREVNGVKVVDHANNAEVGGFPAGGISNPDPGFYQPGNGNPGVDIGPTIVQERQYQPHHANASPWERSGK